MKKLAIAMLAAGALATSLAPAATASEPGPADSTCSFTSVSDPNPEAPADTQTGYLDGGPIAQNGTIKCTIKVGVGTHDAAYVNGASASATGTNGVTYLPPTIVSYVSPSRVPVYLCSQFTGADDGVTWYWDDTAGNWTTTATSDCSLAISGGTDDPLLDPIWDLLEDLDEALIGLERELDKVICPVLAQLAGTYTILPAPGPTLLVVVINSQGDIYIDGEPFWDCPPYDIIWP